MTNRSLGFSWFLCAIVLFGTTSASAQQSVAEGTWQLVSRKLPDGTTVAPPNAMGIASWIHGHRSSNLLWKGSTGATLSSSLVSEYKFTASEYTETLKYMVFNGPTTGQPAVVDLSGDTKTVPINVVRNRIEIKLPFDPVTIVVEGNSLTATSESGFIDYWARVK